MDVDQLELMCKQLYETADTNVRNEAEKALIQFAESSDCLSKCQQLLERGSSPYAQLLAATTLTKVISRNGTLIPILERVDIRHYILNYFATRPKLEPYVQQALMLLFCRLTKLGWFDSTDDKNTWPFRNILDTVGRFLQSGDSNLVLIGVQLLSNLVLEMNQISEAEANRSLMKHRKIAFSFRDQHLYDIFRIGCSLLKNAASNIKSFNPNNESEHGLVMHSLRLVQNCLTFDFIGTANDESADDLGTVQIPTGWRNAFREDETVQLFFDLYVGLPPTLAAMALSCLVQIASIRRSLFNNTERAKFLNCLVQGVKSILQSPQGLSEAEAYHEFCRLVARLKSNYQLGELVKVDNYPEFIKLVAEFTVKSLQSWHCGPNSVHYLLSLWQRMVASVPYVKATEPHLLERFIPQITTAYITSRLEAVPIIIRDGLEDPLDDPSALLQQLDQLSTIGRCEYEKTCGLLVQLFDQSAHRYQELLSYYDSARSSGNDADLAAAESRLTWLVFIIGAVIGGRVSFSSTDEHDAMDGELVCRVLQLMRLTDQRLAAQQGYASPKLELAFLAFFEHFRKIYIGDNVQKTSKVYRRLAEVLGLNDETMVLSVYIQKIVTNLKYWGGNESIISRTLTLLSELSVGYSSVRKLVKLDTVQFVLSNHTSDHFPFLSLSYSGESAVNGLSGRDSNSSNSTPRGLTHMKHRTTFYTALGRLLMVDLGEDEERFAQFVTPLTSAFDGLAALMSGSPGAVLTSPDHAKLALVGLARDLRGIAYSLNSKASYALLFDWLYPIYSDLMIRATVDTWYAEPGVTTPVLKLFAEIAQNRSNRLQFDVSSPNGFLLFKEVSKLLVGYGSRLLNLGDNIPKSQLYAMKLKGISICFAMLKAVLCGNYVNFGVFSLYGDDTLDKALEMFVSLLLSISQADLLQYPKLSQTYYTLLECLAQDHVVFLAQLDPSVFLYILSTISEGLTALDTMVCAGCCATLDNILTFIFKLVQRKNKPGGGSSHSRQKLSSGGPGCPGAVGLEVLAALARRQALAENNMIQVLDLQPQVFQQMLSTVLNIIMFEDCRNQWSMSRPLLPLILLNEKYFTELRQSITSNQPVDRQEMMAACFDKLMDGIERSLLIKNRDKFTQNLSVFRRDVNDSVKSSSNASNSAGGGGGSSPPSVAFGVSGGGQQQHTETMMLT